MPKNRKRRPPRLEKPKKQYSLDQCGLYAIKGKGQLLSRLKVSAEELLELCRKPGAYKVWNNDGRLVQEACPALRRVHARIATLLRRITPPNYRHSGVRRRSFLTNAQEHLAPFPTLKLDIKSFYPSTTASHVWRFFSQVMQCSDDIAKILAEVCCYHGRHVPTGGVHSEVLSFYCHKPMLDLLYDRVTQRGGKMTVYVDDIVITMPNASLTDLEWVRRLMKQFGLTMHCRKSRVIRASEEKFITGVSVLNGRVSAPAGQHKMVKELYQAIGSADPSEVDPANIRSLQGHLDHIAQIEPGYQGKARGNRMRYLDVLVQP